MGSARGLPRSAAIYRDLPLLRHPPWTHVHFSFLNGNNNSTSTHKHTQICTHTQLIRWKSENESDQRVAVIQLVDQLSSHMLVPTGQLTFVSLSVCMCMCVCPLIMMMQLCGPVRKRQRERKRKRGEEDHHMQNHRAMRKSIDSSTIIGAINGAIIEAFIDSYRCISKLNEIIDHLI